MHLVGWVIPRCGSHDFLDRRADFPEVRWGGLRSDFKWSVIRWDALGYFSTHDAEIFEKARAANVIVITKDRDFREMVLEKGAPPQVVWVTCGNTSTARLQVIFEKAFPVALEFAKRRGIG